VKAQDTQATHATVVVVTLGRNVNTGGIPLRLGDALRIRLTGARGIGQAFAFGPFASRRHPLSAVLNQLVELRGTVESSPQTMWIRAGCWLKVQSAQILREGVCRIDRLHGVKAWPRSRDRWIKSTLVGPPLGDSLSQ